DAALTRYLAALAFYNLKLNLFAINYSSPYGPLQSLIARYQINPICFEPRPGSLRLNIEPWCALAHTGGFVRDQTGEVDDIACRLRTGRSERGTTAARAFALDNGAAHRAHTGTGPHISRPGAARHHVVRPRDDRRHAVDVRDDGRAGPLLDVRRQPRAAARAVAVHHGGRDRACLPHARLPARRLQSLDHLRRRLRPRLRHLC